MNTPGKIAATALLIASSSASATDLLSQDLYKNELDRCIATVREELQVPATQALRHRVSGVSRTGYWYEFDIETSAIKEGVDDKAGEALRTSHCSAHRLNEKTRLQITGPLAADQLSLASSK